jgi:hypothetical protein
MLSIPGTLPAPAGVPAQTIVSIASDSNRRNKPGKHRDQCEALEAHIYTRLDLRDRSDKQDENMLQRSTFARAPVTWHQPRASIDGHCVLSVATMQPSTPARKLEFRHATTNKSVDDRHTLDESFQRIVHQAFGDHA